jgi:ribosomal protein L40E
MPTPQDRLLGRIAIASGMITQEQLDLCLALQEQGRTAAKPLGEVLLEKGFITPEQRARLLLLQKRQMASSSSAMPAPPPEGEEPVFGRLVLKRGLLSSDQLNEALRHQERELSHGRVKNLGQVLVEKGYLTREQVKSILTDQQKIIVVCSGCGSRFNAVAGAKLPKCPACGGVLASPPWSASLPVIDSIRANGETAGLIGKVLGGFKLLEYVSRSAKGSLYKAQAPGLVRSVAVKVIVATAENRDLLARYVQTSKLLATLSHPNLLRVHAAGIEGAYCYVVTDFIHGRSLNVFLERGNGIPPKDALNYARAIARGLAAAHARNILHRDLTPDNVLLSVGRDIFVKDFGFARHVEVELEGEKRRHFTGTPAYMAPELWQGDAPSVRTDLYALGATLYALLAGRRLYDVMRVSDLMQQHLQTPPPPLRVSDTLTEGLAAVVERLLAKDPKNRYPSADEVVKDLTRVEGGEAPRALTDLPAARPAPSAPALVCLACGTLNAPGAAACKKCGDKRIGGAKKEDEFTCVNCGSTQKVGARRCTRCRVEFCHRCQRQVAAVNNLCAECLYTGAAGDEPGPTPEPPVPPRRRPSGPPPRRGGPTPSTSRFRRRMR